MRRSCFTRVLAYEEARREAAVLREAMAGSFFSGAPLPRWHAICCEGADLPRHIGTPIAIIGQPRLRDAEPVTALERSMVVPGEFALSLRFLARRERNHLRTQNDRFLPTWRVESWNLGRFE